MSKLPFLKRPAVSISLALLAMILPGLLSATPVTVTSSVSANGPLYVFDFTVTDNSLPNLLSITLTVPSQASAVQNLVAPAGFFADFDPGVGLVDFVSDTSSFSIGTPVTGWILQSPFQLGSVSFSTLSLDANQNPVTTTGTVSSIDSATPEPSALGLMAVSSICVFCLHRKKHSAGATNSL